MASQVAGSLPWDIYELKVALTPSRPARATKDANRTTLDIVGNLGRQGGLSSSWFSHPPRTGAHRTTLT